ncbi:MAG TPA: oligopeptide ABC transporter permease [Longimicrobiales bacterium]
MDDAAPRSIASDPESAGSTPVPVREEERGAIAAERPPAPVPRRAVLLSAVLPGAGHVAIGAWARGLLVLLGWGLLLALAYLTRGRLAAVRRTSTLDDDVAAATLLGLLVLLWAWALYDLLVARRRVHVRDSQWRIAARHFRRNRTALAGLGVIVVLYLAALLAPLIAPHDPIAIGDLVRTGFLPPSREYWLGTDRFGRDVLSRILYGARISLSIGFVATAISVTVGLLLGAVAGYVGGRVDALLMRFTDMVLAFPRLILLILVVALFEPSLGVIIVVLGLTQWPGTTRIVRGEVLSLREREFIQAAHALGMRRTRIILRHLVPNVLAPVIVAATLGVGNTIVLEAGLSFLGLGVPEPTPSWGKMVAEGSEVLFGAWWLATFPGLAIVVTVLAFNLVGDGLRDALDPRLRS